MSYGGVNYANISAKSKFLLLCSEHSTLGSPLASVNWTHGQHDLLLLFIT